MGAFLEGFIGGGGSKVFVDGVKYKEALSLASTGAAEKRLASLPVDISVACIFKGEIYAFASPTNYSLNAYRWDGSAWSDAISVVSGASKIAAASIALEHEGEVHFLKQTYHAKWDGETYETLGTLPVSILNGGCACSRKGELHVFKGTAHYRMDGAAWTQVSTLPFSVSWGAAVVDEYDNIHLLDSKNHYMWDGAAWTQVSTLPYSFASSSAIFNAEGELEMMGASSSTYATNRYRWNGSTWTELEDLIYSMDNSSAVLYGKHIYRVGGDDLETMFTVFDVKSFVEVV